jgi:quinol monooxygenase YgiN
VIYKVVHYQVKQAELGTAKQAILEFVNAITQDEPQTVYEAFAQADGVSFVHFMSFRDEAAEKYHQSAPHTMKFVEVLYPRCEVAPQFTDLTLVGTTRREG